MSAPEFAANGKQVLRDGQHYANASDEAIAAELVELLNGDTEPQSVGACMIELFDSYDAAIEASPDKALAVSAFIGRLTNGRNYALSIRRLPDMAAPAGEALH